MRLLTLLLAALLCGLALLWGGEPRDVGPVQPPVAREAAERSARQRPEAPADPTSLGQPGSAETERVSEREAVAPATATLDLRVVRADQGGLLPCSLQVWQLGVAADETWEAGDRKVFDEASESGRVVLADLDPGVYRAFVWDGRLGSTTPAAFELVARADGGAQVVEWPVTPAAAEPMWLTVVDQHGAPVGQVQRKTDSSWRLRSHGGMGPDWARQRRHKDEIGYGFGIGGGVGGGGGFRRSSHTSWRDLEQETEGWLVGRIVQDSRRIGRTQTEHLRQPGGEQVTVVIEPRGANRFLAVLPDRAAVLAGLVLPDEQLRERAEQALSCRIEALALGPGRSEAEAWHEVVVTIQLHLGGHQPLSVAWRPALGPPPELVVLPEAR